MTTRMIPARLVALTAVAALMLLFPASVAAHAELQETTPADGATVEGTPDELVAAFDEPLLPESSLSIRNAAGDRLAVGRVDPDEPTHLLISDVPELAPGPYEMRWTAATADGHIERGTWSFTVTVAPTPAPTPEPSASAPASPAASPSATPEPSPSPEASPSASPGPSDPTGGSDGDVILPIIVALAIVLIAAALLLSRRGRPSGV